MIFQLWIFCCYYYYYYYFIIILMCVWCHFCVLGKTSTLLKVFVGWELPVLSLTEHKAGMCDVLDPFLLLFLCPF